ncbi:MAG TPA: SDR family NAD(P)-dependent oxidoreductase [Candidatus Limiplasma sp.]|mgnify:CR=1 FL=1|nr:SDR family NAD(P)-dependent oxidoreductase [Candidatus Limiplasma sp.]HRX09518.1 SDR family NAD(P)-dependent oxidoreductase [Candidatus Limiplasma sp.]
MTKKLSIITGANAGIGKQAAIQLAQAGHAVIIGCRSMERGQKALEEIRRLSGSDDVMLLQLDVSLKSSIEAFADKVKAQYSAVDVLIHNAAVFDIAQKERRLTAEGFETVWMTNHIGPVYLTELLLDLLKQSDNGRVITIASKGLLAMPRLTVDLNDPEFKNRKFNMTKAYYQSKRAQIMFTYDLAEKLRGSAVTANCIRVPAVQIDLSRHPELSAFTKWIYRQKSKHAITPQEMAKTYVYLATSDALKGVSGKYFDEKNQYVQSNAYTRNRDTIKAVMNLTAQYLRREAR